MIGGGGRESINQTFHAAEGDNSDDASDDTSSSCYPFATPGDWVTEAAFGGVFTSMHEDAQKWKKKNTDDMVRQWQQGVC